MSLAIDLFLCYNKNMIKNKRPLKLYFGKVLKSIATFAVMASCFVGCKNPDNTVSVPEDSTPLYTQAHPLPTEEQTKSRLLAIYEDESKMYMLRDYLVRFPAPVGQEKIKVNLQFSPTRAQKLIFEDCIEEFNNVFDIINPNYQFEINYSPTQQDLLNPYGIDVKLYTPTDLSTSVVGHAWVPTIDNFTEIDSWETYDSYVELREDKISS